MTSLGDENGRKMTRISNRQVVENSQSEITRSSNRPIKSRAVHQRRFLFCYSSLPLQGSFDGDSFFSASAPRLASPFLPFSAFSLPIAVPSKIRCVFTLADFCESVKITSTSIGTTLKNEKNCWAKATLCVRLLSLFLTTIFQDGRSDSCAEQRGPFSYAQYF